MRWLKSVTYVSALSPRALVSGHLRLDARTLTRVAILSNFHSSDLPCSRVRAERVPMAELLARFGLDGPYPIPSGTSTRLHLAPVGEQMTGVETEGEAIVFHVAGWFEVLLTVEWDPNFRSGHRFAHTAIPDSHPLHSEAIDARVLGALSGGRQLLHGNTISNPPARSTPLHSKCGKTVATPLRYGTRRSISACSTCLAMSNPR